MAADATVRGRFELSSEAALRDLTSIRDRGREADEALNSIGRTMDRLSIKTSRPKIELQGWGTVNAQLTEIEDRLDRLNHMNAGPRTGVRGALPGGGGGVPGGFSGYTGGLGPSGAGRNRAFSTPGGFPGRVPWWAAALPFAGQLAPGLGAVGASAGSAALGAGTVGLGGLGILGAGAGLTFLGARGGVQALEQITKAQQRYNLVVAEFGRQSTQAATAARNYNAAVAANPAAVGASRQLGLLRSGFASAIAPARAQFYQGASGVFANARRALPSIGADATVATGASANAAVAFSGFLAGAGPQRDLRSLTAGFATELPIAERSLQHITTLFGNLSVDAIPFFHEANVWVANWTSGLARSSNDQGRVQAGMERMVDSARDWARLTGAGGRVLKDLFAPGVQPGNSLIVDFTHTLDRWDVWLKSNPDKVRGFFDQGVKGTEKIAGVLGNISKLIMQIFQAIDPLLSRAEDFMRFASGLGGGSLLTGIALAGAGYRGFRGSSGFGLPGGGGLLAGFVGGGGAGLGRAAARGGGGGISPALYAAGGAAGAGSLSRVLPGEGYAFRRVYAGAPGSRFGAPVSELGRGGLIGRGGRFAGGVGRGLVGAAEGIAPILAAISAVEGLTAAGSAGGGGLHRLNVGLSTALSLGGILPERNIEQTFAGAPTGASLGNAGTQASLHALARQAGNVRTADQLHAVQRGVNASILGYELSGDQARQLTAFNRNVLATAARNAGAGASNTWQSAFSSALGRGVGPNRAVHTLLGGIDRQITQLGPQGATAFGGDVAKWVSRMEQESPRLRRPLQRVMQRITNDLNAHAGTWGNTFQDLQRKIFYFNGQILKGSTATWKAIGKSLTDPMATAQETLNGTFGIIQQEAVNALTNMGFTRQQAGAIVKGEVKGGQARKTANLVVGTAQGGLGNFSPISSTPAGTLKHARGGFMVGGQGLLDTVNLGGGNIAAPGEGVITNRHTLTDISRATRAMYGLTAEQMIQGETRQHAYPSRKRALGMTGSGGGGGRFIADPGTDFSYGQEPQIAGALGELARQLGVTIYGISGHRSAAHSVAVGGFADDPHTRGMAADIGVNSQMRSSAGQLTSAELASVGLYRPFPGAQEINHVQLLSGGARAGAAGRSFQSGSVNLRTPRFGMSGVPGALGQKAAGAYAQGLQQQINGLIGGGVAGGISAAGFSGGGSARANEQLGQQMMLAAGWGMDQWPALLSLWNQESGWNANAVNPSSGAAGIPQALGHGNVFRLGDAPAQIAWGLNYIRGRYGSPAGAWAHEQANNWYSRGGSVNWAGWNAKGGSFVTNGPTLFGAGEGGKREHVNITPAGSGGRSIVVNMERVYLGAGDKAAVKAVAEDVADAIIEALDRNEGGTSDRKLAGAAH